MTMPRIMRSIALLCLAGTLTTAATLPEPDSTQKQAMNLAFNISDAFEYAAEKIEDSVVHITVQSRSRGRHLAHGNSSSGLGSGVIVDERGYILTNHHVTATGNIITARLADGRELDARLVGSFEETDIAVLKIEADNLTAANFGDSEALRVGQWVLAVGSPFGFEQTITAGIVSAKGRGSFSPQNDLSKASQKLQEFIQTDAAINPGNSGGPLVDLHGDIIGINTAIISRTGANNGLGFAIPADIAKAVMEQIIETGRVERGWLGVDMGVLSPRQAHELDIEGGVIIKEVVDDSPAQRAKLRPDDIIISLGGRTTENIIRLSNAIMLTKPNELVEIEYIRNNKLRSTSAIVTSREQVILLSNNGAYIKDIGITIIPNALTKYRGRRPVGTLPGFVVSDVDSNSSAAAFGLEARDFIYLIDGQAFETAQDVKEYFDDTLSELPIRIQFYRGNQPMYINLPAKKD